MTEHEWLTTDWLSEDWFETRVEISDGVVYCAWGKPKEDDVDKSAVNWRIKDDERRVE